MRSLGFKEVISLAPYEKALRDAAIEAAQKPDSPSSLIIPACPAVVNLIELRFPSLIPHMAQFDSPIEAIQSTHAEDPAVYIVSCPSQRSALISQEVAPGILPGRETITEYITNKTLRQPMGERLFNMEVDSQPRRIARHSGVARQMAGTAAVMVTGVERVVAVLEDWKTILWATSSVIEPWACPGGGCFGSPFYARFSRGRSSLGDRPDGLETAAEGCRIPLLRRLPFTARPGFDWMRIWRWRSRIRADAGSLQ